MGSIERRSSGALSPRSLGLMGLKTNAASDLVPGAGERRRLGLPLPDGDRDGSSTNRARGEVEDVPVAMARPMGAGAPEAPVVDEKGGPSCNHGCGRRPLQRGHPQKSCLGSVTSTVSLVSLVALNTGFAQLARYSKTKAGTSGIDGDAGGGYINSTAVASMEVCKLAVCLLVLVCANGPVGAGRVFWRGVLRWRELLRLSVPSLLYVVQNNLTYVALTHLDAVVYQLLSQLKILCTALMMVAMLGKRLSRAQWMALLMLTVGVGLVQTSRIAENETSGDKPWLGLLAVLGQATISGYAGVYFEKVLKGGKPANGVRAGGGGKVGESPVSPASTKGLGGNTAGVVSSCGGGKGVAPPSQRSMDGLWVRNLQMGCSSVILSLATVALTDGDEVIERGFFAGYGSVVWGVVALEAANGLVISVVVNYGDNIIKGFASSYSIVASLVIEMFAFCFLPPVRFLAGTSLVVVSTVVYLTGGQGWPSCYGSDYEIVEDSEAVGQCDAQKASSLAKVFGSSSETRRGGGSSVAGSVRCLEAPLLGVAKSTAAVPIADGLGGSDTTRNDATGKTLACEMAYAGSSDVL